MRRRLVSPSSNLQLSFSPLVNRPPLHHRVRPFLPTPCDCSPAELSQKASAVFRRDAPPPGVQGLHEW